MKIIVYIEFSICFQETKINLFLVKKWNIVILHVLKTSVYKLCKVES